jgi:hypothetical protein
MSERIDAQQRDTLASVADVLIPAGSGLPSARAAGIADQLLDMVLTSRPDLVHQLADVLDALHDVAPADVLGPWRAQNPAAFDVLSVVIVGGYLMSPEVGTALGYPGQQDKPVDTHDIVTVINEGLLDPVIERGPIYRPTPTHPRSTSNDNG